MFAMIGHIAGVNPDMPARLSRSRGTGHVPAVSEGGRLAWQRLRAVWSSRRLRVAVL